MFEAALQQAAESAIFGFFCILDGVRSIENATDKGTLELYFVKESERTLLNDPHAEELHNLFNVPLGCFRHRAAQTGFLH